MPDGSDNTGAAQGGTGDGSNNAAQGGDNKQSFTPEELQAHTDKVLNKRYGEIQTTAEAKNKAEVDTLTAKIKELEAGKGDGDKGDKGKGEDLTALETRLAVQEKEIKQSQERDRISAVRSTVAGFDVVSGEQVATLVSPAIKRMEDGNFSVLNAEGQRRINAAGKPMSVQEYVGEFLTANPHLVKAGGGPGGGSHGAGPGGPVGGVKFATIQDVRDMSDEDFDKAIAEGVTLPGPGPGYVFKTPGNQFRKNKG